MLHFFFESKNSSIFQLSFYFFGLLCFSRFSFSVCFFLVSFIFSFFFFNLSKQKIFSTKALSRKKVFEIHFLLNFFLRKEHILIQKRMCSKLTFVVSPKKKKPFKKNLFQDSHALRIPCAIESPLDHCCVSWRTWASKVYVHSVVIDLGRGHLLHQAVSLLLFCFFFAVKNLALNVFLYPFVLFPIFRTLFWLLCFDCSSKSKISWQKIHFSSFHFLVFILMFPSLFCLSLCFCQGDLIEEDKTRHQEKWVEATKESALADDSWPGLAAMVCFLWLSDLCVTQTARGTPASECWSSSPYVLSLSTFTLFMFTLLPQHVAKSHWKHWATWGGEAEARRFDGLCRRSKEEDRAGKTKSCGKTTQWHGRRNKQTGR